MSDDWLDSDKAQLLALLEEILTTAPEGLSEHTLFGELSKHGLQSFSSTAMADELALFRAHFVLFHALYELRDALRQQQRGDLEINCLRIAITPNIQVSQAALAECEPLRSYYGDLQNLAGTTRLDVEQMLAQFWSGLTRHDARSRALAALGLRHDASPTLIKQRYRELALEHHPDRGGDASALQAINAAMDALKRC